MKNNNNRNISWEDIQLLIQHSSLNKQEISRILKRHFYATLSDWKKFIALFLIIFGVGFTISGIIFFFAYNWDNLDKFIKFGLIVGLLVVISILSVYSKIPLIYRKILLTGASVLVGVLFAVFGQVYQTGANAYDLFLMWLLAITIWTLIANFPPLWLIYVALANTVLILHFFQVQNTEKPYLLGLGLIFTNILAIYLPKIIAFRYKNIAIPQWYTIIIEFAITLIFTIGCCAKVLQDGYSISNYYDYSNIFMLIAFLFYGFGYLYALKEKQIFFVAVIPLSLISIVMMFLFRFLEWDSSSFFTIGIVIIILITLLVRNINKLQKTWRDERV